MLRKTLDATTTVTDQELGTFTALASAWDIDREGDTIARGAFVSTIAAWVGSGKALPLLWEHSTTPVGSVDPLSMRETADGLVVAGQIDMDTEAGAMAWRLVKSGAAGFSIGYMAKSRPRKGGGSELVEIDLLEISVTSKPMHPATRALDWKSAEPTLIGTGSARPSLPPAAEALQRKCRAEVTAALLSDYETPAAKSAEMIVAEIERQAAERKAASRPVRIASFDA